MKKEEFPTFLNEQPTVIFGRTTRELLIMACGSVAAYSTWQSVASIGGVAGPVLASVLAGVIAVLSIVVALVSIGYRPLEEWFFCWLFYVVIPKLYLYKPLEEDRERMLAESNLEAMLEERQRKRKKGRIRESVDEQEED